MHAHMAVASSPVLSVQYMSSAVVALAPSVPPSADTDVTLTPIEMITTDEAGLRKSVQVFRVRMYACGCIGFYA